MTVKPVLWPQGGKDGRHDVKMYIHADGKKKYRSTGIKILPAEWDDRRGKVKKANPLHVKMNGKIERMRQELAGHLLDGGTLLGLEGKSESFADFLAAFVNDIEAGRTDLADGTAKKYRALRLRLSEWMQHHRRKDLTFSEVNIEFYFSFRDFLIEHAGCTLVGGFSKHIQVVKRLMNLSRERGLHDCTGHLHPQFKRYRAQSSRKIYLTETEVDQLATVDLSATPHLKRYRDAWVVAYYLLLRFSDLQKISRDRFLTRDGRYYYRAHSQKKGTESAVPVKPLVRDILERCDYRPAPFSNPEINRHIKTVAALAGITGTTEQDGQRGPKWQFVTMHTSRRSIATNLKLQGVSVAIIADLGGWKDVASLQRYLRNSAVDAAVAVEDNPIFN